MRRPARPLFCLVALLSVAAPARAAAPPWIQTSATPTKTEYYQGMTSDGAGHLFFDGVTEGGYRTDLALREQARTGDLIPPTEPFNHIGDWTYDKGSNGRLILPLECFTPGAPNGGNTCGQGAFGVADPRTMTWQYRVLLDKADIAKAMWAEVSPDGKLVWTSSGSDLLAYSTADVNPADAGPATIHPVRRLPGAVPPSGVTGAVFDGDRLLLAGQTGGPFEVWSVDLTTGARTLEISADWAGESEGLDLVDALGGELHWQVQPLSFGRPPTFGGGHGTVVSFVRRTDARIRLRVTRRTRTRLTVQASLRYLGRDHPLSGVHLTLGRAHATTNSLGRARLRRARGHVIARSKPLLTGRLAVS